MDKNKPQILFLYALLVCISVMFVACGSSYTPYLTTTSSEMDEHVSTVQKLEMNENSDRVSAQAEDRVVFQGTHLTHTSTTLGQQLFLGEGEKFTVGGDGMTWYYQIFGADFYFFPMHFIQLTRYSTTSFDSWIQDVEKQTNSGLRNLNMNAFIDYFDLTLDELIAAHESAFDKTIAEIDYLVSWARTAYYERTPDTDLFEAMFWRHQLDSSDIAALFSNNVYEVWESFPGHGVVYRGSGYSPEWIANNAERALFGERLPFEEIERVIDLIDRFLITEDGFIEDVSKIFNIATEAYTTPTTHYLNFSVDGGLELRPLVAMSWDYIIQSLEQESVTPVKNGYDFAGWYFDEGLTIEITDIFRMPARDTTLYARWEESATLSYVSSVVFFHEAQSAVAITVTGNYLIDGDLSVRFSGDTFSMNIHIDDEAMCCCDGLADRLFPFRNITGTQASMIIVGENNDGNVSTVYIEIYLNEMPTGHVTYIFDSLF